MMEFDVVTLGDTDHPTVGETVPSFTRPLVTEEFWEDRSLADVYADQPVLLVFHPMDGAFPSTYIYDTLESRGIDTHDGIKLVGCSISTPYAHAELLRSTEIDASLFSDPANEVAEQFDIVNDLDGMAGISEPRPAVFLIDTDGTVLYDWVASEWPEFPEYDAIEDAIAAL
ncbi:redoxin domain-containing protein [Halocatena halophila]|uniref:redoxin domain-containing protein n=1 Tax=Halocatena halophila TaxID=2814576 RepID=UPI002ED35129